MMSSPEVIPSDPEFMDEAAMHADFSAHSKAFDQRITTDLADVSDPQMREQLKALAIEAQNLKTKFERGEG